MKSTLTSTVVLIALLSLSSCKQRTNSGSPTLAAGVAAEKVYATCTSAGDHGGWDLELRQDHATAKAQMKYWKIKGLDGEGLASEPALVTGVWENAEERSPFERLYVFAGLRMIISLDRTSTGFYPATILGKDATGTALEENLMCSIN